MRNRLSLQPNFHIARDRKNLSVGINHIKPNSSVITGGTLELWVRANSIVLYTTSAFSTLVTSDGDPVGGWVEQSGNGAHPRQSSSTRRGTYRVAKINGLDVVEFLGGDFLEFTGANILSTTSVAFTIFCVGQYNGGVDGGANVSIRNSDRFHGLTNVFSTGAGNGFFVYTDGVVTDNNARIASAEMAPIISLPYQSTWIHGGGTTSKMRYRLNRKKRILTQVAFTGTSNGATGWRIAARGDSASTNSWVGYIGEVAVFEGELADWEIEGIETYLAAKWGLS